MLASSVRFDFEANPSDWFRGSSCTVVASKVLQCSPRLKGLSTVSAAYSLCLFADFAGFVMVVPIVRDGFLNLLPEWQH